MRASDKKEHAMRLAGRVAVIAGGGSGIGAATAKRLAEEGAAVVVADINEATGSDVARDIASAGGRSTFVHADVSSAADVEHLISSTVDTYGRIDVLHNNAFWNRQNSPVVDTTDADWDRTLDVTLKSVYLACKFAIPEMVRNDGGGSIINTASIGGLQSSARLAAYVAAKGGVIALTRSIALDYGAAGIRCNAVCPGTTETPLTAEILADPERRKQIESRFVLGRVGQPIDVANAVLFLASDESRHITGTTLVVDGGRMIS